MTDFRFLHAADIHLGSPLRKLLCDEEHVPARIRRAPRAAFEGLVALAVDENVDFVVVAGDLLDGACRDRGTGAFLAGQLERLDRAGIPVFLGYGNHDAESRLAGRLAPPGNTKVFGSLRPETFRIESLGVALHGQSYARRVVTDNLVSGYPPPLDGMFNVGVLHTGLGGRGGYTDNAPCTLPELVAAGYDYWALGHVHDHEILNERPHVVFPGNLQGRHVREAGPKGCCLVTVEGGAVADVTMAPVDVVRWASLTVDAAAAGTVGEVVASVRRAVELAAGGAQGRLLACRIRLVGRGDIRRPPVADGEDLLARMRADAAGLGDEVAWIEGLVVETTGATRAP